MLGRGIIFVKQRIGLLARVRITAYKHRRIRGKRLSKRRSFFAQSLDFIDKMIYNKDEERYKLRGKR